MELFCRWLEITQDPEHQMIKDIKEHFKNRVPEWSINNILEEAKKVSLK